jgi:hypothetical protein
LIHPSVPVLLSSFSFQKLLSTRGIQFFATTLSKGEDDDDDDDEAVCCKCSANANAFS